VVARTIRARLQPLATAVDSAATPELLSLATVHHLRTPIRATLRAGVGVLDVAAALHPTPAVGGAPAAAAHALRRRVEDLERGWYAGPIGWMAPNGDGVLTLALRSALLAGDRAYTFAGAGIVRGSDPEKEWQETELKLQTVTAALRCTEVAS